MSVLDRFKLKGKVALVTAGAGPLFGSSCTIALAEAGAATLARAGITAPAVERNPNDPSSWGKVGRNEVCPCGSGKKFKHCHGKYG